jgi:hypothetical protein
MTTAWKRRTTPSRAPNRNNHRSAQSTTKDHLNGKMFAGVSINSKAIGGSLKISRTDVGT